MIKPRVAFLTFGCRVNRYDADAMRSLLEPAYELVEGEADVYILNGCSVTALAEKKARQAVHRLRAASPDAVILVTGCLGEAMLRGMTSIEGVDLTAGAAWRTQISDAVAQALAGRRGRLEATSLGRLDEESSGGPGDRVRAFLKVQDGCSARCTYCRAVQLRGAPRSKSIAAALREARRLVAAGCPEIVLCGVSLAEYAAPDGGLPLLVRRLLDIPDLARLRLASLNVAGVTDDLLDAFANDARLCPHFHVPLQSGDDGVLRAMRRPYTAAGYRDAAARILNRLPAATLGSDIIVGFPGESEAAFAATCRMVEDIAFANLHVFRFSARPGTEAADLPGRVPESAKRDRAARLASLWSPIRRRLLDGCVGKIEDVLVEAGRDGRWQGHTAGYFDAVFQSDEPVSAGDVCPVRITGTSEDGLEGAHDESDGAD